MKTIAFIFARGGSKGLPGKNIRSLAGKPLIAWSIDQANSISRVDRVIVSTDSEEIANVARQYGAEVPFMRPEELARDDSPEFLAWRHALSYLQETEGQLPDVMLSLPTTAPLRLSEDIENCLDVFERGESDVVVTVTDAHRSPYFNMLKENQDGTMSLVIPPPVTLSRRQDTAPVYDMTTVAYAIDPKFALNNESIFSGRLRSVHVPLERAIDIDTLLDFRLAEFFLMQRDLQV